MEEKKLEKRRSASLYTVIGNSNTENQADRLYSASETSIFNNVLLTKS
jgi:hypothetical protein